MKLKNSSDLEKLDLYYNSIIQEINLYPCLGLVSKINSGSHTDMDYELFYKSANIFKDLFKEIINNKNKINVFNDLKRIGFKYEKKMFEITEGVNTHKGLIFCSSIFFLGSILNDVKKLQKWIKIFCIELKNKDNYLDNSIGNKLYKRCKINGARYQAISGYKVVFKAQKFYISKVKALNIEDNYKYFLILLYITVKIKDTTLINKIGLEKYNCEIKKMKNIIKCKDKTLNNKINEYNSYAIENNISPGGAADLLVMFFYLNKITKNNLGEKC